MNGSTTAHFSDSNGRSVQWRAYTIYTTPSRNAVGMEVNLCNADRDISPLRGDRERGGWVMLGGKRLRDEGVGVQ